jgi:hypothetical protein
MDIVVWLRGLGLGKYEAVFRDNDIDETVLPSLTHENLKELGVFPSFPQDRRAHRSPLRDNRRRMSMRHHYRVSMRVTRPLIGSVERMLMRADALRHHALTCACV